MTPPQLWQHTATGKRYIVLLRDGAVVLAAGPLSDVELAAVQANEWLLMCMWGVGLHQQIERDREQYAVVWPQEGEA